MQHDWASQCLQHSHILFSAARYTVCQNALNPKISGWRKNWAVRIPSYRGTPCSTFNQIQVWKVETRKRLYPRWEAQHEYQHDNLTIQAAHMQILYLCLSSTLVQTPRLRGNSKSRAFPQVTHKWCEEALWGITRALSRSLDHKHPGTRSNLNLRKVADIQEQSWTYIHAKWSVPKESLDLNLWEMVDFQD